MKRPTHTNTSEELGRAKSTTSRITTTTITTTILPGYRYVLRSPNSTQALTLLRGTETASEIERERRCWHEGSGGGGGEGGWNQYRCVRRVGGIMRWLDESRTPELRIAVSEKEIDYRDRGVGGTRNKK